MTARILCSCILTLAIFVPAGTQQAGKEKPMPLGTPYYPLNVGTQWTYQVGDHQVTVRVARSEIVEIKVQKPDADKKLKEDTIKVQAFHLEAKSDDRVQTETVAVLEDGVYRLAAAGKDIVPPLCFLKLPVNKAGETWQVQSMTEGMTIQGTFTAQEDEIEVPYLKGKVKALKASSDDFQMGKNKMKLAYWFVPEVGMVQQHLELGSFEVRMKLAKMPGKP